MTEVKSSQSAEERVSGFYNTVGWVTEGEVTEDAKRFEDLREFSQEYNCKTRMRVMKHIPESGDKMIDMASGPIQYREYVTYSENFNKRYCVDFSIDALNMAKEKIGDHGEYLHGNFLTLPIEDNYFDCAISLHTIYHIDKDQQEEAVRKLLRITRPGKPVIIVYSNPNTLWKKAPFKWFVKSSKPAPVTYSEDVPTLYFHQHPNRWWKRFKDEARVKIYPWRAFGPATMRRVFPNNGFGKFMLKILYGMESIFPAFFANNFEYNMIVLTKK